MERVPEAQSSNPTTTVAAAAPHTAERLKSRLRVAIKEWGRTRPRESLDEFTLNLATSLMSGLLDADEALTHDQIADVAAKTLTGSYGLPGSTHCRAALITFPHLVAIRDASARLALPETRHALRRLGDLVTDVAIPEGTRISMREGAERAAGIPLPIPLVVSVRRPLMMAMAVQRVRVVAPFVLQRISDLPDHREVEAAVAIAAGTVRTPPATGTAAVVRDIEAALRAAFDDALNEETFRRATGAVLRRQVRQPTQGARALAIEAVAAISHCDVSTVAGNLQKRRHGGSCLDDAYAAFLAANLRTHPAFHKPGRYHRSATRFVKRWLRFRRPRSTVPVKG